MQVAIHFRIVARRNRKSLTLVALAISVNVYSALLLAVGTAILTAIAAALDAQLRLKLCNSNASTRHGHARLR
jgi:ABC-type protease/lipase transport system fused ATPase/permease subunit